MVEKGRIMVCLVARLDVSVDIQYLDVLDG
jgi:hypothetical protein